MTTVARHATAPVGGATGAVWRAGTGGRSQCATAQPQPGELSHCEAPINKSANDAAL